MVAQRRGDVLKPAGNQSWDQNAHTFGQGVLLAAGFKEQFAFDHSKPFALAIVKVRSKRTVLQRPYHLVSISLARIL
jgi:hypothetical protein